MKAFIITVFKTENCGSFLQAWALKEQLEALGCEVFFGDYKSTGNSLAKKAVAVMKSCLRFNFKRAVEVIAKTRTYREIQKSLHIASPEIRGEVYFYGSDTLWNFDFL